MLLCVQASYTQIRSHGNIEVLMWTRDGTDEHVAQAHTYDTHVSLRLVGSVYQRSNGTLTAR